MKDEDELFFAALGAAPGERRAFVEARAGDERLASRVLGLLRAEEEAEAEGFMSAPPWAGLAEGDALPRRLGEFEILGVLGRGGMGIVFHARDAAGRARQRFAREVQALGRLDHPNIVRSLGTREAQGTHLLVMEHVQGEDLADHVARRGPLPVAEACRLAAQAARGLHHAHERG
ncbi:MAG: protein kinase, partial [Gemmataceae bacterium]|nr:protein kinase [Gemmataceae bacterium]